VEYNGCVECYRTVADDTGDEAGDESELNPESDFPPFRLSCRKKLSFT